MDEIKVNLENLTDKERKTLMTLVEKSKEKEVRDWKPKKGEKFWVVHTDGSVCWYNWYNDVADKFFRITRNCFKTEEEAEFHREEMLVQGEIKRLAKEYNEGWKPNWDDFDENKYYICFDFEDGVYCDGGMWTRPLPSDMYFKSKELCEKAIGVIGKDRLKKYWFKGE